MAYTSIITVDRLDNSLGYVQNKEKTTRPKQHAAQLNHVITAMLQGAAKNIEDEREKEDAK